MLARCWLLAKQQSEQPVISKLGSGSDSGDPSGGCLPASTAKLFPKTGSSFSQTKSKRDNCKDEAAFHHAEADFSKARIPARTRMSWPRHRDLRLKLRP